MQKNSNDEQIQQALAADDPAAIELLWQGYGGRLFGFLRSMLFSAHDAEDVLQEVFVNVVRHRERVATAGNLKAYLFRMARNSAINLMRKQERAEVMVEERGAWLAAQEEDHNGTDGAEEIAMALAELPEKQRTVIVLKIYEDMTFAEIGGVLRISANTAASRYRYGVDKLRQIMRSESG